MRSSKEFVFRFLKTACACAASMLIPMSAKSSDTNKINASWDWTGIIGTGQSLSIGARAKAVVSTNQPYHNLKLATDHLPWPIDSDNTNLALVPLVEPIGRLAPNYPSSWPENISGETPHSGMANEISALVQANFGRDYVSIHSAVGEDGQGMIFLKKNAVQKGLNGHSYEAAMTETKAITRLAKAAGKTYGIGAITLTHGETDAGNTNYENELVQLSSDYNTDLPAITGQKQKILMIVSQQNSCADHSASTLAQWKIGVDHPAEFVCSGPKYQYPYFEGIHLSADGYRQMGEKYAQVYYQRVILGKEWQPLQPVRADRQGKGIIVLYHVPVPPLVWDANLQPPHPSIAEWKDGKGFEVTSAAGEKIGIASVQIMGDAVMITCASDPGSGARIGYAMVGEKTRMENGTFRWGLLRDSDPFKGSGSGKVQPNYGVAFEMTVE
jgi:hypothetical protein